MLTSKKLNKGVIYLLIFLFTLHLTPTTYINSSYLEQFIDTKIIGYIYSIASALTIICFFYIRKVLRKKGNYKTVIYLLFIETASLLIMAFAQNTAIALSAFVINFITTSLVFFNIDIFLESASSDKETGGIRGYYMTFLNLAFLIGPFIASFILTDHDFWKVYLLGVIIQIPVIYIIIKHLKNFEDPVYTKPRLLKTFKKLKENSDLYSTFASGFLLRIFFSVMVVYTPLYLIDQIGFKVSETTLIIAVSLLPFVLLEIPLGKISDKFLGEKEILTYGFLITAVATSLITFINSSNIIIWMLILFVTRIGATMIEISSEVHLFKRIDANNIDIIGLFRSVRPIAYIISPIIASILLLVIDFKFLYLILGAIMLYGLRYSLSIKDTK